MISPLEERVSKNFVLFIEVISFRCAAIALVAAEAAFQKGGFVRFNAVE